MGHPPPQAVRGWGITKLLSDENLKEFVLFCFVLVCPLAIGKALEADLGERTHTLVSCWMPKPLPPKNQCTGWFTPALETLF